MTCTSAVNPLEQRAAMKRVHEVQWWQVAHLILALLVCCGVAGKAFANACVSKVVGSSGTPAVWATAGNWNSCGGVAPQAADTVTISAGAFFTVAASTSVTGVTVNGTLYLGTTGSTTARTLTVTGVVPSTTNGVVVSSTGTFTINASGGTHALTLSGASAGGIANAGIFDMAVSTTRRATVTLSKSGTGITQTISGSGTTYDFYRLVVNQGTSQTNTVDVTAAGFSVNRAGAGGYITITNGTFKISAALTAALNPFDGLGAATTIPATGGFWVAANAQVDIGTVFTGANFTNTGLFQVDAGAVTVTSTTTRKFVMANSATTNVVITGGTLTVGGMFGSAGTNNSGTFDMQGGTMLYATAGTPSATAFLLGSNTTLNLSGGTIIQRYDVGAGTGVDLRSATANVTGGTWQIADSSSTGTNAFQISTANAAQLWNLLIDSTTSPSLTLASNLTVLNNVTVNSGATLVGSSRTLSVGGNFQNDGTFTSGTGGTCGTVTFIDNAVSPANADTILGGTATSFCNLTVSNASGIDITTSPTITNVLTFTSGLIRTSTNMIILGTAASVSGAGTGWVVGNVQKNYSGTACGISLSAIFPVGDANNYAGLQITGGTATGTGAGNTGTLTVSTSTPDLAQVTTPITTTIIDKTRSLNRYWTVINATLSNAGCANASATLTYPSGDNDGGATPANYIAQRYDRSVGAFFPTTLTVTPTATSLSTSQIKLDSDVTNDIAIGEVLTGIVTQLGNYNAFDTGTTSGAITGLIQTKVSGTTFNLAIVAVNAQRTATSTFVGGSQYTVELYDATTAGTPNTEGCATSSWTLIQSNTNITPGAVARFTTGFTVTNAAYKKVRVRVVIQGGAGTEGCSTDYFAIRPASLSVAAYDSTYQAAATAGTARPLANSGATGGNVHSAATSGTALPFTLRATAKDSSGGTISTYQSQGGAPSLVSGTGACVDYGNGCTNGTLVIGSWAAAASSGSATGEREATANYDEAGALTLQIEDLTFADADIPDGSDTTQRHVPAATAATIGRFVPSQFKVEAINTPQLAVYCGVGAAAFTYIGQKFAYRSTFEPQARITAQNSDGNITTNYRGSTATTWHLTKAMVSQTYANLGSGTLDDSLAKLADAAMTLTVNSGAGASGNGTASLTISSNDRLLFTRNTSAPSNAFNAAIRLTVAAGDTSETGVTGNPASITTTTSGVFDNGGTGIQFVDTGNTLVTATNNLGSFRYGRLRLSNAVGSERLSLNVPIQAEYWVSNGFTKNTDDTCTVLNPAKTTLSMGNYKGTGTGTALSAANMTVTNNVTLTGANVNVSGYLKLSKPSPIATGSVDLTVDLSVSGEDKTYLRGAWNGATTYTADPTARASFGMYGSMPREFIYFRENY